MKDRMIDFVKIILKSKKFEDEKTKREYKNTFLDNGYAREYFTRIFLSEDRIKILNKEHYDMVSSLVLDLINKIEDKDDNIPYAVEAIKGCLNIKPFKEKNKKKLSDDLYPKLTSPFLSKNTFWEKWIEKACDLENEFDEDIMLVFKENYIQSILPNIMEKMKLDKSFREKTCDQLYKKYVKY